MDAWRRGDAAVIIIGAGELHGDAQAGYALAREYELV